MLGYKKIGARITARIWIRVPAANGLPVELYQVFLDLNFEFARSTNLVSNPVKRLNCRNAMIIT
jgi:hypothetical protein